MAMLLDRWIQTTWRQPEPLDEVAIRKGGCRLIERGPYVLAVCAVIFAVGQCYGLLSMNKALALVMFGLLQTRFVLMSFRAGKMDSRYAGIFLGVLALIVYVPMRQSANLSWFAAFGISFSIVLCGAACVLGTTMLLLCLFRAPFVSFIEAVDESPVTIDEPHGSPPPPRFDY